IVPVVAMRMCDQHRLYSIQHFIHRAWKRNQWVIPRLRRILDGRHGSHLAQHGIYEQTHAGVLQQQRGVADELKLHQKISCAACTVLQWMITVSVTLCAWPPA